MRSSGALGALLPFTLNSLLGGVTQPPPSLALRGDRFRPLSPQELSPDQQALVRALLDGPRGSLEGPFNLLLRTPELGGRVQQLGEVLRFRLALPARLRELAILLTARWWRCSFAWELHRHLALEAGLEATLIEALRTDRPLPPLQADEQVVIEAAMELRQQRRLSDATFAAASALLGEPGLVELVAVFGYYDLVAMLLNVDRYPLPPGVDDPFPEPVAGSPRLPEG